MKPVGNDHVAGQPDCDGKESFGLGEVQDRSTSRAVEGWLGHEGIDGNPGGSVEPLQAPGR